MSAAASGASTMKLLWSPKSPFVRKVMIVIHELGLAGEIELVRAVANPRGAPNPAILRDNPLGKIPVLLVTGRRPVFDSAVICDWLAESARGGERLLPRSGEARLEQLRWQALGDGLTENLLLWRSGSFAPGGGDPEAVRSYEAKVRATLRVLDGEAGDLAGRAFGLGQIAVICALGQLDFRIPGCGWRAAHPSLVAWADRQGGRASVAATVVVDDQGDAGTAAVLNLTFEKD